MIHDTTLIPAADTTTDADLDPNRIAGAFLAQFASIETRRSYTTGLRQWFDFLAHHQVHPLHVRRTHFDLWQRNLEAVGLSANSRAARLSTVKSFYAWCYDEDLLPGNPAGRVKGPKRERPVMPALNRHEAHRFMQSAEDYNHPADAAAVALMMLAGLRVTEVCTRNIADLNIVQFVGVLEVLGKGSKRRRVELPPRALAAIHTQMGDRPPNEPLILNQAGRRLTKANVRDIVERTTQAADVSRHMSPHCLRRTFIQVALDSGAPVRDVQLTVGHSDSSTTAAYDRRELGLGKSPVYAVQVAVA